MFVKNAIYVHPVQGFVRLEDVVEQQAGTENIQAYRLIVLDARVPTTIQMPVAAAEKGELRALVPATAMGPALEILRQKKKGLPRVTNTRASCRETWRGRIQSGDFLESARVLRDLNREASEPPRGRDETQLYEAAMVRLAGEMALVCGIGRGAARQTIEEALSGPRQSPAPSDEKAPRLAERSVMGPSRAALRSYPEVNNKRPGGHCPYVLIAG